MHRVVEKQALAPDPMVPRPATIKRRRTETGDTFTIELEEASGSSSPTYLPGQFNMIYLFGAGDVPISIAGAHNRLAHTIRSVGMVTRGLSRLRRGDQVGIRGPFGSSWPLEEAVGKDVIIVAGGFGIAAVYSAIWSILSRRKQYNTVALLYGSRTPKDILYRHEFDRWSKRGLELLVTVDRGTSAWSGNVGLVTTLIPRIAFDPRHCLAMICGPEIMMRFTALELRKHGVPDARLFLSMERNMKCATGFCGHCQFGPEFICKDGPIFRYDRVRDWLNIREL